MSDPGLLLAAHPELEAVHGVRHADQQAPRRLQEVADAVVVASPKPSVHLRPGDAVLRPLEVEARWPDVQVDQPHVLRRDELGVRVRVVADDVREVAGRRVVPPVAVRERAPDVEVRRLPQPASRPESGAHRSCRRCRGSRRRPPGPRRCLRVEAQHLARLGVVEGILVVQGIGERAHHQVAVELSSVA